MHLGKCLAKTENDNGCRVKGMNVTLHTHIVGYVAKELLEQLNQSVPVIYKKVFGVSDKIPYLSFLAALHDVGKVNPLFQHKIYGAIYGKNKAEEIIGESFIEEGVYKHNVVSSLHFLTLNKLYRKSVKNKKVIKNIAGVLDRHHGKNNDIKPPVNLSVDAMYGNKDSDWFSERNNLILKLYKRLVQGSSSNVEDILIELSGVFSDYGDSSWSAISGMVCVSDWIGSSIEQKCIKHNVIKTCVNRVIDSGFVGFVTNHSMDFETIFNFTARDVQNDLIDSVIKNGPNKVYVFEAPMGIGKTEASLYAAYKLISNGDANGIYFGMPTQLTSNKIHERVNNTFLKKCFDVSYQSSAILAHGNASLNAWGAEGMPGKSWFSSSKRSLLTPFGVGTVDQALMSTMRVKHSFVRAFGLVGKVVILDEIHSYDAYTGFLLKETVKSLIKNGCTVIILSATLTQLVRDDILGCNISSNSFPLVSCSNGDFKECTLPKLHDVKISRYSDQNAIKKAIDVYNSGGMVLWVENTIVDAQEIYVELLEHIPSDDLGLLHSRYTSKDREKNESHWIDIYGKNGDRSKGKILIGTQVVEQSIDIDSDLIISRLCPMDMLIQRIGRLFRHLENNNIRPVKEPECIVLTPRSMYGSRYGRTEMVYGLYYLLKTMRSLPSKISIPHDIRDLLNKVYESLPSDDVEQESYNQIMMERRNNENQAKGSLSLNGITENDDRAPTRLNNPPSTSLILLKKHEKISATDWKLTMYDGSTYEVSSKYPKNKMDVAIALLNNSVTVPIKDNTPVCNLDWVPWLQNYAFTENDKTRIVIIDNSSYISQLDGITTDNQYDSNIGYVGGRHESI